MTNRKGFCKEVIINKKEKIDRGTLRIATATAGSFGVITSMGWLDTKPVHFLSVGLATTACSVRRRKKDGTFIDVLSSNAIHSYQQNMGGVDHHDYLRMARYSIQTCHRFRKWYKLFFCAMIDMVLVNSYILYKMKTPSDACMTHAAFNEQISCALIGFRVESLAARTRRQRSTPRGGTPSTVSNGHNCRRHADGEGYAGRGKRYKRCVVCQKKKKKVMSEYSCDVCGVCVCMRADRSDGLICWIELHENQDVIAYVQRKLEKQRQKGIPDEQSPRTMRKRRRRVAPQERTTPRASRVLDMS
jgi:hypothetical protein